MSGKMVFLTKTYLIRQSPVSSVKSQLKSRELDDPLRGTGAKFGLSVVVRLVGALVGAFVDGLFGGAEVDVCTNCPCAHSPGYACEQPAVSAGQAEQLLPEKEEVKVRLQCLGYGCATFLVHLSSDIVTIRTIVTSVEGGEPFTLAIGGGAAPNLYAVQWLLC